MKDWYIFPFSWKTKIVEKIHKKSEKNELFQLSWKKEMCLENN